MMADECGVEKWERGRSRWLLCCEGGRRKEVTTVRRRQMWEAFLTPAAMVRSRPRVLPRARSASMILLQSGSVCGHPWPTLPPKAARMSKV